MTTTHSKSILLQPEGCLNSEGSLKLQEQIAAIIPEQYSLWVIDMNNVDFIDSSGLVALIGSLRVANQNCCRLVLCNLPPAAKLIFEITQLDRVFEILESHAEVVTALP